MAEPVTGKPGTPQAISEERAQGVPLAAKFPWPVIAVFAVVALGILAVVVRTGYTYVTSRPDADETDWDQLLVLFAIIVNPATLLLGAIFGFTAQLPGAAAAAETADRNKDIADKSQDIADTNFDVAADALAKGRETARVAEKYRQLLQLIVSTEQAQNLDFAGTASGCVSSDCDGAVNATGHGRRQCARAGG